MKKYNVAVVGVGAVGRELLRLLKKRKFPFGTLKVFARSARDIEVAGATYPVEKIDHDAFGGIDIALFAGTEGEKGASKTYSKDAIKQGAVVIDNGKDYRLEKGVPLVIPEVNSDDIFTHSGLIANPNCSTIQMVLSIYPILKLSPIERLIISTYQAASGAGSKAASELFTQVEETLKGKEPTIESHPKRLAFNVIPQIGSFGKDGYTTEEWKLVNETHKILHNDKIKITSTCVRVPVKTGHSQAVYLETEQPLDENEVKKALKEQSGIKVIDESSDKKYPLPYEAEGKDEVFVGRIRKDPYNDKGLWLWVVSDNLLKGAALNAVQIAEVIIKSPKS